MDSDFLTCCSDRIKVHIFKVNGTNTTSYFGRIGNWVPIAGSEWSFSNILLKEEEVKNGGVKALIAKDHLHVFTTKGTYYKAV